VTSVSFYLDINGDGLAGPGELLGADTDGSDGWTWSGQAFWAAGQHTYLATAADDGDPALDSEPVSTTGAVGPPSATFETTLDGGDDPFTFRDATGDWVTIVYSGGGRALVRFDGPAAEYSDIESILITGTTSKSSLVVRTEGEAPVGDVEICGRGFRSLEIDGDLGSLDLDMQQGKSVRNIVVGGALGDVDARDVKKINLIQADDITGDIDAQYVKRLIANDDFDGARISLGGSRGRISELRAGDDVLDSDFSAARGIKKVNVGGSVIDSTFEAFGYKGKLNRFDIGGDVEDSGFSAVGRKGSLGKFYVDGDIVDSEFTVSESIKAICAGRSDDAGQGSVSGGITAGRDLKKLECGGALDADIEVGRNIKSIVADQLGDCAITAGGKISKALFDGAIYGTMEAHQVKTVRTSDYFRDPVGWQLAESMGPKNSYTDHLFSVEPLRLNKIFDADGDMT
jgi:hypothetical protein